MSAKAPGGRFAAFSKCAAASVSRTRVPGLGRRIAARRIGNIFSAPRKSRCSRKFCQRWQNLIVHHQPTEGRHCMFDLLAGVALLVCAAAVGYAIGKQAGLEEAARSRNWQKRL